MMITTYISSFLLLTMTCIIVYLFFYSYKRPASFDDAAWLSDDEVGLIERDIEYLEDVIVLADRIEEPTLTGLIRAALLDNFMEGVRYTFIISPENYETTSERFYEYYRALIKVAAGTQGAKISGDEDLCHILSFRFERQDYPYIFYKFQGLGHGDEVIAFRGDEIGRGIANEYRRLEPEVAYSVLTMALHATKFDREEDKQHLVLTDERFSERKLGAVVQFRPRDYMRARREA